MADELHAQRVGRYTSAPPIYRLAWRLGLHIRPPLYQSFGSVALGMGAWFALVWGLMNWLLFWQTEGMPLSRVLVATLAGGLFFGLSMAIYYRRKAARLKLPPLEGESAAA